MVADTYTHDFIYRIGDGPFIVGEVEFNHDKKASFRMNNISEPMPQDILVAFTEFIERIKKRFDDFGSLKHVEIKEKGYVEPV